MSWSLEWGNDRKINLLNSFEYVPMDCIVRGSNASGGNFSHLSRQALGSTQPPI